MIQNQEGKKEKKKSSIFFLEYLPWRSSKAISSGDRISHRKKEILISRWNYPGRHEIHKRKKIKHRYNGVESNG
jgi:hypothetical protein